MSEKQWYSIPEFAKLVGWSRRYVLQLVKARLIRAKRRRGDRRFKIPRSELIEWGLIEENENEVDLGIG